MPTICTRTVILILFLLIFSYSELIQMVAEKAKKALSLPVRKTAPWGAEIWRNKVWSWNKRSSYYNRRNEISSYTNVSVHGLVKPLKLNNAGYGSKFRPLPFGLALNFVRGGLLTTEDLTVSWETDWRFSCFVFMVHVLWETVQLTVQEPKRNKGWSVWGHSCQMENEMTII